MANIKRYTALYVYTDIIQLVDNVRTALLWVVPVKSRYGDTCVTYEQPQFHPLGRSNNETLKINIRSDTGELISSESGTLVVTIVFRISSLFHWCFDYQHLKEPLQRDYGNAGILKELTTMFAFVVKKGLWEEGNLGKQALRSGV